MASWKRTLAAAALAVLFVSALADIDLDEGDAAKESDKFSGKGLTPDLVAWAQALDPPAVINSKLESGTFAVMGSGIKAKEDIAVNETLLEIPLSSIMTQRSAAESEIGPLFLEGAAKNLTLTNQLALHVMFETSRGAESKFAAYLSTLPAAYDLPITWGDEDLDHLRGSRLYNQVGVQKQRLLDDFHENIQPILEADPTNFPPEAATFEKWEWAMCTVLSRNFLFGVEGQNVPVLVPVADAFNHDNVDTEISADQDESIFRIRTKQAYKAGDQVFVNLGSKSNMQLLFAQGFSLPQNVHDTVSLTLTLDDADPFSDVRARMLGALGIPREANFNLGRGYVSMDLLNFVRVQVMSAADFDKYPNLKQGKPVSLENEMEAFRHLIAACQQLLQQGETTVEEDSARLAAEGGLQRREAFSVVYKRGEKLVYLETIQTLMDRWGKILIQGLDGAYQELQPQQQPQEAATQTEPQAAPAQ